MSSRRVWPRTVISFGLEGPELNHLVRSTGRGADGPEYYTVCNETLITDAARVHTRRQLPTCLRCFADLMRKRCIRCYAVIGQPLWTYTTAERCEECKP